LFYVKWPDFWLLFYVKWPVFWLLFDPSFSLTRTSFQTNIM
jgi:hypothetical protein